MASAFDAAFAAADATCNALEASGALDFLSPPALDAADRWGPFAPGLSPAERIGRLRMLRTIVHMTCGPSAIHIERIMQACEGNPGRNPEALAGLAALPADERQAVRETFDILGRESR